MPFTVSQQLAEDNAANNTSAVPPVIDPRHDETDYDKTDDPAVYFTVNGAAIRPSPTLAEVE